MSDEISYTQLVSDINCVHQKLLGYDIELDGSEFERIAAAARAGLEDQEQTDWPRVVTRTCDAFFEEWLSHHPARARSGPVPDISTVRSFLGALGVWLGKSDGENAVQREIRNTRSGQTSNAESTETK